MVSAVDVVGDCGRNGRYGSDDKCGKNDRCQRNIMCGRITCSGGMVDMGRLKGMGAIIILETISGRGMVCMCGMLGRGERMCMEGT